MKDFGLSNDLQEKPTQALDEMKAKDGDKFDLKKVNLAELVRRTGIPRKKLRHLKENNFIFKPHGNTSRKAEKFVILTKTFVKPRSTLQASSSEAKLMK